MSGDATNNQPIRKEDIENTPLEFIAGFLRKIKDEAASVESLPASLTTLIKQTYDLASGLKTYPIAMSSELSDDVKLLDQKTREIDFGALFNEGKTGKFKFFKEMASDHLQGNFLKMLVRMTGAKRILEIGTFTGFAALNMAEALPSDGRVVTMEKMPTIADIARDLLSQTKQNDKIEVQAGAAIDLLQALGERNQQFDFVFIDAAKPEYKDYVTILLDQNILAPRGTMVIDNTLFKGVPYCDFPIPGIGQKGKCVHPFNQYLLNEPRVEQVMLPVNDGVTIVRRVGE